jgi:hypothetical protein
MKFGQTPVAHRMASVLLRPAAARPLSIYKFHNHIRITACCGVPSNKYFEQKHVTSGELFQLSFSQVCSVLIRTPSCARASQPNTTTPALQLLRGAPQAILNRGEPLGGALQPAGLVADQVVVAPPRTTEPDTEGETPHRSVPTADVTFYYGGAPGQPHCTFSPSTFLSPTRL